MNRSELFLIVPISTLALALLVTDLWLGWRNYRYTKLIETYECGYSQEPQCEADFDGDGHRTRIEIHARADAPIELPPKVVGGAQDLMRINIFSQDNSSRTHLAVRTAADRARLLIYDGSNGRDKTLNLVYAWNGKDLVAIPPDAVDRQILSAMAARDDTGTLNQWAIYWLLMWPLRMGYSVLFLYVWVLYRRYRQVRAPMPETD